MNYLNNLLKQRNMSQLILLILFVIYLVMDFNIPEPMASLIDTNVGKIIVVLLSLMLFAYSNPVLGVLGILVAYQILNKSTMITGLDALQKFMPTEQKKWSQFSPTHQFPYTLEQEIVKKMTISNYNSNYVKTPYKPMLDDIHDASYVNEM
jgi:hypothetical protein